MFSVGVGLSDRVRSSVIRQELGLEPLLLCLEWLRWFIWSGCPLDTSQGRCPVGPVGRRPRGRPRTRDYISTLPWERLGSPRQSCPRDPTPDKWITSWLIKLIKLANSTHTHTQTHNHSRTQAHIHGVFLSSPFTCVVWLSAALCCHGATLPGSEKRTQPSLTMSSEMKVTLMRTVAPGGRFPTLMVNTSWRQHHQRQSRA